MDSRRRSPLLGGHELRGFSSGMLSILKPWFIWRPWQIAVRMVRAISRVPEGIRPLAVAWGADIMADPRQPLGASIRSTGVYDLAVSETLARLISPGDTVIDAGANIGYMTVLAAAAAGPSGKVISFEPHPEMYRLLMANVERSTSRHLIAPVEAHNEAVGATEGIAELVLPGGMSENEGLAYLAPTGAVPEEVSISVPVTTLDAVLGKRSIAVMKLDVEGHELSVLRGAGRSLEAGRIRHIVFEDHEGRESEAAALLVSMGYTLFSVGWALRGLKIQPAEGPRAARAYEAPSYLATLDPAEVRRRCSAPGWRVLRSDLAKSI